jgi:hypothetical protein
MDDLVVPAAAQMKGATHSATCACTTCEPELRRRVVLGHTLADHPHRCYICRDLPWAKELVVELPWAEQNRRICALLHRDR